MALTILTVVFVLCLLLGVPIAIALAACGMLGIFLVMSVIVILLNFVTDTIYRIVDPRVSLRAAS